jgi:hypothetical protein
MSDEPFYSPKAKPAPLRRRRPGERLFEFRKGSDHYVGELRYHGEFGVEAQFLLNGDLYIARTFQDQPDFNITGRELAVAWATQQRTLLETRAGRE